MAAEEPPGGPDLRRHGPAARRLGRLVLGLALGLLGFVLWELVRTPPLGTDSLIYQLDLPARWVQAGLGADLSVPFHDCGVEHAPLGSQALHYLLIRATGDLSLTWVVQPAAFLVALGLYWRTARLLGASRALASALTALLGAFFPPFFNDLQLVNSDMLVVASCAALLHGVVLSRRRPRAGLLWAAGGTAAGLLTKTLALFMALVAWPLLVPVAWGWVRAAGPAERGGRLAWLGAAAGVLLVGAAFFGKNWVAWGNPLYPAEVSVLGVEVFAGRFDAGPLRDHGWTPSALADLLWDGEGPHAIRPPFSTVLWLGWLGAAAWCLRHRRAAAWPAAAACVAFPLGLVVLHFAKLPYWDEPRYLFPVWYALALALAFALARLVRVERRTAGPLVPGVVAVAFLVLLGLVLPDLGPGPLLPLAAGAGVAWAWERPRLRRALPRAGLAALVLGALAAPLWLPAARAARDARRARLYAAHYGERGEVWAAVAAMEEPLTIAYAGTQMTLPLRGPDLQHRVVYVPLSASDRPPEFRLDDLPPDCDPSWYWVHAKSARVRRAEVEPDRWLAGLDAEGVDLLYLATDPWRGGVAPELGLVRRFPGRFRPRFRGEGVFLFEVLPAEER